MTIYGAKINRGPYTVLADVIGEIDNTPSGNVLLRVGKETEPHGPWTQTSHVVLTPDEGLLVAFEILAKVKLDGLVRDALVERIDILNDKLDDNYVGDYAPEDVANMEDTAAKIRELLNKLDGVA